MKHRWHRFLLLVGGILIGALLAIPSSAAADTPVAHWGSYGPHYLTDTVEYPGVSCHFNENYTLDRVRVRPPVIYAKDRGPGTDSQWVGWQVIVRGRAYDETAWHTVSVSSIVKAKASDNQAASFKVRNVPVFHLEVKVAIKMIWYKPGSSTTIAGWARHRVDNYQDIFGPMGSCPAEHF